MPPYHEITTPAFVRTFPWIFSAETRNFLEICRYMDYHKDVCVGALAGSCFGAVGCANTPALFYVKKKAPKEAQLF